MPELPEVETIRLGLEKHLLGHKIEAVEIIHSKIFQGDPQKIIGAKFIKTRRLGKVLILDLDNNFSLVIHVKMTGQLIYSKSYIPHKHTHVIFKLKSKNSKVKGDAQLFYNDIRKFGWIRIVPTNEVLEMKFLKELGPEPLFGLTINVFQKIISNKSAPIKTLIMDQTKIGGVGNIYANDALFLAGIHPSRKAATLSKNEINKLFKALENVLRKGIKYGGSSENTYLNALGERGSYQEHSLVYGKKGKNCPKCKSPIQVIRLGGRGTFFCPRCQA